MIIENSFGQKIELGRPVITIGTFDGVHLGHKKILEQTVKAAQNAAQKSVLITFHPHPRKLLFPDLKLALLTPLQEKLKRITHAGIDEIIVVPFDTHFAALSAADYIQDFLIKQLNPSQIVIGYDHHFGADRSGNLHLLKHFETQGNFIVTEIDARTIDDAAISSTKIRNSLQIGDIVSANHMLGYNYSISGKVATGKALGRTIGFPTANLEPTDIEQIIPQQGVYAGYAWVANQRHKAMINVGTRPSVSDAGIVNIEAHLLDFDSDIYQQSISLEFVARMRHEQKFANLDMLKAQLAADKRTALEML